MCSEIRHVKGPALREERNKKRRPFITLNEDWNEVAGMCVCVFRAEWSCLETRMRTKSRRERSRRRRRRVWTSRTATKWSR